MSLIKMISVTYGVNEYHLEFQGYIPEIDPNLLYDFDFIGTDINVNTYLSDKARQQLKEELVKDYGYAPYDIKRVKEIFGTRKEYYVNSVI